MLPPFNVSRKQHLVEVDNLIERALREDGRDLTADTLGLSSATITATLLAKESGILCGTHAMESLLNRIDSKIVCQLEKRDGDGVNEGETFVVMKGARTSLLRAERVLLNIMQHLSGIATATHKYVQAIAHTKVKILDTRKTLPAWRASQKYAVLQGGGHNHRMGLSDLVLVKENHVRSAGGQKQVLEKLAAADMLSQSVAEARNLEEACIWADGGVPWIMLDNFSVTQTEQAVAKLGTQVVLESSGGIHLDTVAAFAETGVNYISVGALTHSVRALDISMLFEMD